MAPKSHTLSARAASQLAEVVRRARRQPRNLPARRRRSVSPGKGGPKGWITFATSAALLASDASQANCPVVLVWEGTSPGSTVTVYNELGWEADAGVDGYAKLCGYDGKWKIIIVPCPAGAS